MGDMSEIFAALRENRKKLRLEYGVKCPRCAVVRPLACPSLLLPGQRCKVDGYTDPRPLLGQENNMKQSINGIDTH